MRIEDTLKRVQDRISTAAIKSGRNSDNIKLITVSKTIKLQRIIEAVEAGSTILGESRVQEAKKKITNYELQITNQDIQWHLIGNLQKNKARDAVRLFDLIQSVDSIELAEALDKYALKEGKIQNVLVQIKISDEQTKHGAVEQDLIEILEKISTLKNLRMDGLMAIPPYFKDKEKTRPFFIKLRQIADKAGETGFPIKELSMGMSSDFEVAIEEGATMVRVGSAIFGERNY